MNMSPYLGFKGDCEAAFTFYAQCLGGELGPMFRYAGSPMAEGVPAGWEEKLMHASVNIGGQVLMGADVAPEQYEEPKGFSLSLQLESVPDAERIYAELAREGRVVVPLEETFWARRFGMVVDRFGVPWLINCEGGN